MITFRTLGEICNIRRGSTITKAQTIQGNIPVVAGGITPTYYHNKANREKNTISVSASGANAGYVNFWNNPIFASDCTTIELNNDYTDIKYIYYFLKYKQEYIYSLRTGAAQPHVYGKDISLIQIPLPNLKEQSRIVAILDQADELRQKRREAIDKLDELIRSVFLKKFYKKGWVTKTVSKLVEAKSSIRTGPFGSQLLHSEFIDSGIAVLGIDNAVNNQFEWGKSRFISDEKYQQLKRYTVKPDDVLITIMGTCGKCAIVPKDIPTAINTKHLCCITLNQDICLPIFLHSYFLLHPTARNYLELKAKGAIMSGLNMGIIRELPVELPSIQLQHDWLKFYQKMQTQKHLLQEQLEQQNNLFHSLQQQAFNGTL